MKDWDPDLYRERAGFVSDLGAPVVDLLAPRPGERILDVGCGDGVLTEKLLSAGCEVVAIDASVDMVEAARTRGIDARVVDAATLVTEETLCDAFDAVFSNAALHWMHPMETVADGIYRCLKPAGRFVAEFGGEGNVAVIRSVLHEVLLARGLSPDEVDPWRFPSPDEYSALLTRAGFRVQSMEYFDRPTELADGITSWVESVARPFLQAVPSGERDSLLADVERLTEPRLRGADGIWRADYVRLRVSACKVIP